MNRALATPADAARRAELNRMRAIATGLLVAMTVLFTAMRLAPTAWPWTPFVQAFAEAAMVGACADWFAVTALFRRPFGLPIPHTAIIPRNKARIGRALGDFIAGEFLTPRVLDARIRAVGPARRLADWLVAPGQVETLTQRLTALAPDIAPSGEAVRAFAGEIVRRWAQGGPSAPLLGRLLGHVWSDAQVQRLLDRGVGLAADYLAEHEASLRLQVAGRAWRWLPRFIDQMLAEKISHGLLAALQELRDPDHPWRVEIDGAVRRLALRLQHDPALIDQVEAIKTRLLADPSVGVQAARLWAAAAAQLDRRGDLLGQAIAAALTALGRWLDRDAVTRERLDGWLRVAARRALSPRREAIGALVAQVVDGWDAREVVEKLELHVGRDLQYIRINGTVVGGLVGLAIYTATRIL